MILDRQKMQLLLGPILLLGLFSPARAAEQQSLLGKDGCRVVNPHPVEGESITWTGGCKDGYANGEGTLEWLIDGKVVKHYEGPLVKGIKEGQGYTVHDNGYAYEGPYVNNLPDGVGVTKYTNGDRYDGTLSRGIRTGFGKMTYATGGSYEGEWKAGRRTGKAKVVFAGGRQAELEYKDGVPVGALPRPPAPADYSIWGNGSVVAPNNYARIMSSFPLEKTYAEFDPAEKRIFRSIYPMLADGDDPPYPSNGAAHVIRLLSKAAEKLSNSGHLELTVLVDSKGKAQSVEIIASPSKALAMVAAKTVIDEKFKPAVCGGQPCAMVFLLSITIEEAGVHR
jgi:hypothetical protein